MINILWFFFLINFEMDELVVLASGSQPDLSITRSESRSSDLDHVSSRHHRPAEPLHDTLRLMNPEENVNVFVEMDPVCDAAFNCGNSCRLGEVGSRPDNVHPGNLTILGRWPSTVQHRAEFPAARPNSTTQHTRLLALNLDTSYSNSNRNINKW